MTPFVVKIWHFSSETSTGRPPYQTLLYDNGATSCNCWGWCKRTSIVEGRVCRSCKHTRLVDSGQADAYACAITTEFPQFVEAAMERRQKSKQERKVKREVALACASAEPEECERTFSFD